jgi:hypothetical protein
VREEGNNQVLLESTIQFYQQLTMILKQISEHLDQVNKTQQYILQRLESNSSMCC